MRKILGIAGIFLVIVIATSILSPNFLTAYNIENLLRRTSLFGILSIGVGFVILTAGIDLSIGGVCSQEIWRKNRCCNHDHKENSCDA